MKTSTMNDLTGKTISSVESLKVDGHLVELTLTTTDGHTYWLRPNQIDNGEYVLIVADYSSNPVPSTIPVLSPKV